jgi:hypothetical protein
MSTYNNGPGNVPRLPDRVVDTLIDSAGVSRCAPGATAITVRDQSAEVERLVHDVCEELLARLPDAAPAAIKAAVPILTWQERIKTDQRTYAMDIAMKGEINDLRAALASRAEAKPVAAVQAEITDPNAKGYRPSCCDGGEEGSACCDGGCAANIELAGMRRATPTGQSNTNQTKGEQ